MLSFSTVRAIIRPPSIQIPTGGLGSFSTILIKNFGFSELDTELLSMVNGAVQCVVLLSAAWLSRHYNQTILFQFVRQDLELNAKSRANRLK